MKVRFFVLFLILISCLNLYSQTRRALVIGLGEQLDRNWPKINGDKDIQYIMQMLLETGYYYGNIITLINSQATKTNIVSAFRRLAVLCNKDDIVYVHFSGHGQRITDLNCDENDDWDESWIPYDAYKRYCIMDNGDKHLIDDEINDLLYSIKKKIGEKGKLLVVVDACHSGDSSKSLNTTIIRGSSSKFVIPGNPFHGTKKPTESWLTLSACKNFEYNQEMSLPKVGILSYALFCISKGGHVDMQAIEDFIKKYKGPLPQTPILTGETEKYNISDILR